jgi:hypothetical protein
LGSDFRSLHTPLQDAVEQQTYFPQEPPRRPVLPLHARQAARHWFLCVVLEHRLQKDLQGSVTAPQAVPNPNWLNTAPAKTAPIRRSDSRRGTEAANDLENSS